MSESSKSCRSRTIAAERFVRRSRGDWFKLSEFAHALHFASATAHHYISALVAEGIVERDEDMPRYRMTRAFRNECVATGYSLTYTKEVAS